MAKRKNEKGSSPRGKRQKANRLVRSKTKKSKADPSFYEDLESWDVQHTIHLATPSISLAGTSMSKLRRLTEFTLLPQIVIFLLDHSRPRKIMEQKVKFFIQNTPSKELRKLACTNYGSLSAHQKQEYEKPFDFSPRSFILDSTFDWNEFLDRTDLVRDLTSI